MMLTAPSQDVLPLPEQMIQEVMLSEEYEFPINKTSRVITLPSLYYVSLDDKRNAINYFGHAKDGIEFKIIVGFDVKEENVTLVIQCTPSMMQLDQSKNYKLSSSILWKNNKKQQKEIKIEAKENIIRMPIAQRLREQQIILMNEIIIEVSPKYHSRDEVGFTGIVNNAATCYMNSVFQILFHLGAFQQLVYNIISNEHNQFPCTLQNLFFNLKHSKIAISTQEIIKSFKWDVDQQAIQQDVQEFIMELLKAIGTKAPQIEHRIIDLFQGELENHIQNENFDKSNVEQFMDISLNITNSLQESLDLFISTELLEGENSYNHDELGKQEAVKYHLFKKLPPVLLINLKRYRYEDGGFQKIHDRFQYNEEFNFKEYLVNKQDSLYDLYAVLVHRGEAINHGHYYCYIKPFYQSKQWFKFDDKIVTRATQKEVFENNFGGSYEEIEYNHDISQILTEQRNQPETAYMLVYIKKNEPQLLEQPQQYPQWIINEEEKFQEIQSQKKNFIQTNIFSIDHLNMIECSNIKTGIIFHKQASNQSIDLIAIEEFFDKYTTPALIPKTITISQLLESLSQKIGVERNSLLLFIYKITNNKPNTEQITLMQPQKQFSFYSSQKMYQFGLLLLSTKFEDQILINNFLGLDQIKIDQIQQNGKSQKEQQIEQQNLVIVKTSKNTNVEISQFLLLPKGINVQEAIKEKLNNQGEYQLYFQNDSLEFKKENAFFKNSEYIQVYIDQGNTLENEFTAVQNRREIILKLIPENQCTSQIFDKNDSTMLLLNYIAQIEECSSENIQIKYKDKKGNFQTLIQHMRIEEICQYDSTITYKQTILPVGAMKEQMSFQVEGKNYIILKSMSFQEFMDQENLIETIPLLQSKKDKKAACVLLDRSEKISRACVKNSVQFVKPIILGQDIYIVCFLQSVEVILLCSPLVCLVAKTCTVQEILYALLQQISQNPLTYKTQQIQIMQDCIMSTDDEKTKKLELLMRVKINNQEISQDIPAQIGSLQFEENQITLVLTFLTIRDNKTDKLRQKGVQIL